MKCTRWLVAGVAPALLFGCAHTAHVEMAQTVRLPPAAQQRILDAEQAVDVAQHNVAAAQVAVNDAQQFRDVAGRELDASKTRVEAARSALDLNRKAQAGYNYATARTDYDVAQRELAAALAKKEYADHLVDLRKAQLDERQSVQNLARANVESVKYTALLENGMADGLRAADFSKARASAERDLADRRMRVAEEQGTTAAMRTAWDQRRREYNTAARDVTPLPPLEAPPPPQTMQLPGSANAPPSPGVNEGPSAPQSLPENMNPQTP